MWFVILLTNDGGFQIDKDRARDVFSAAGFVEESREGFVSGVLLRGHGAVGLDAMLKAVELPAGGTDLAAGLANVD